MSVFVSIYGSSDRSTEITLVTTVQIRVVLKHDVVVISFRGLAYWWFEHTSVRWWAGLSLYLRLVILVAS